MTTDGLPQHEPLNSLMYKSRLGKVRRSCCSLDAGTQASSIKHQV